MLEAVSELLKQRIGLDVASIGEVCLLRAVNERLAIHPQLEPFQYVAYIQQNPKELQALIEAVVVGETWFFRYAQSFSALAEVVKAALKKMPAQPVELLSLPCSSGEEPYSMAMCLLDAGILPEQFVITALDVSEQAIQAARAGVYGRNAFRGDQLLYRDRYFTFNANQYVLHDQVKSCVRFMRGNLLDASMHALHERFTVVFCRNLLIYFDRATQLQALSVLKRLIVAEGALFIGPAEANLFSAAGLTPLPFRQSFAFSQTLRATTPLSAAVPRVAGQSVIVSKPSPRPIVPRKTKAQASPQATSLAQLLLRLEQMADQGQHQAAQTLTGELLQRFGPHAELYYWQALLAEVMGDHRKAQGLYRKVLYLQPDHQEALAHLAMLLASDGDQRAAERLQRRITRRSES